MGIFRRRRPVTADLPSSGHAGDDQVLAQLRSMGSDLAAPRLWEHFLYCDTSEGAVQLEATASAAGWSVQSVEPPAHGIVASRSDLAVSPAEVGAARTFFESLAATVPGGEYDGWGAEGG